MAAGTTIRDDGGVGCDALHPGPDAEPAVLHSILARTRGKSGAVDGFWSAPELGDESKYGYSAGGRRKLLVFPNRSRNDGSIGSNPAGT